MLRELRSTVVAVVGVLVVLGIALGVGYAVHDSGTNGDIAVALVEYRITMPATVPAGHRTFAVTNRGTEPHEFVVFRTAARAKALPILRNGDVNESSPLLHRVAATTSALAPGETRAVSGLFTPGHYVAVCTLPLHYGLGMRVDFTVAK